MHFKKKLCGRNENTLSVEHLSNGCKVSFIIRCDQPSVSTPTKGEATGEKLDFLEMEIQGLCLQKLVFFEHYHSKIYFRKQEGS